ncbi:flagellar biosynthetic protein FliO [Actinoplanes sp. NPDC051861]|uniref:flagellar biosynthetic protein FliO n=1 Tax=Actinoplanes sp. NPDC051861 TaxID=3155170 RepID=UPI0034294C60
MIGLVVQVAFSLLVVLFLMWGLARALRRPFGGRGSGPLSVLSRQQLARGSSVAVVRVADRALVLGITDQNVSLLAEADLDAFEEEQVEHRDALTVDAVTMPGWHPVGVGGRLDRSLLSPRTWTSTIDFLRDRTTRR